MSVFTVEELNYLLGERRLARLATVGPDGMPHIAPVGWSYSIDHDTIDIGGRSLERTTRYRDVRRTGRAAMVIDDAPPCGPRGVEIRGRADALDEPVPLIRIHPERIVSWGIEGESLRMRTARSVVASGGGGERMRADPTSSFESPDAGYAEA